MTTELVHVQGLAELEKRLAALPTLLARTALRKAVSKGAAVIRDAARAAAPIAAAPHRRARGVVVAPGTLKRAALIRFVRELSNDQQVEYIVAFRRGKRQQKGNRDAFYAPWVEFGHRIRPRRGAKGGGGGSVPPHPFFGPAFADSKYRALQVIEDTLRTEIAKVDGSGNPG